MLKILRGVFVIVAVASIGISSTRAYFSSTSTITDNTFSTGVLEIRVNGQPSTIGANFGPMAPGEVAEPVKFTINNYGQPFFNGPSNLDAKKLILNISSHTPSSGLWNVAMIKVEVNRGWSEWQEVYNGSIKSLKDVDLLSPRWTDLPVGWSEDLRYTVWLPENERNQNVVMGSSLNWTFSVEGRTN